VGLPAFEFRRPINRPMDYFQHLVDLFNAFALSPLRAHRNSLAGCDTLWSLGFAFEFQRAIFA
jgi:hypothetical protein